MITLTKPQQVSLLRKYQQDTNNYPTYRAFRRTVAIDICGAAMVYWCGMWLGIEPDGYTHS